MGAAAAAPAIMDALMASGALSGGSGGGSASSGIGLQGLMGGAGGGGSAGGIAGLNVGLGLLDKSAAKTKNIFGELNATMTELESPVKQMEAFFDHIAEYVGKFSPAHAQYFGRAVADFQAAIGETLVPVLEFGTKLFRELGDMVASSGSHLRNFFKSVVSVFDELYETVKPILVLLSEGFNVLVAAITVAIQAMKPLLEIMKSMSRAVFGNKDFSQSAAGKAAISVGTDSVGGLLAKTQQNAFSVGGADTPEQQSADLLLELTRYFMNGKFIDDLSSAIVGVGKAVIPGADALIPSGDWIQKQITNTFG